jgi:hypothetical protein
VQRSNCFFYHPALESRVALSLIGGGEGDALIPSRAFSLWVFDRRERLFDELPVEVSVFWTVDGVSLRRLDFEKPRCVVDR